MPHQWTLTIIALLSVVLGSFHLADDVVRGFEPGGTSNYIGIIIVSVMLFTVLTLMATRTGYVLVLLFSVGAAGVPYIHMIGNGLMGPKAHTSGALFFWVWTNLALGATSLVSVALATHGLWLQFRNPGVAALAGRASDH